MSNASNLPHRFSHDCVIFRITMYLGRVDLSRCELGSRTLANKNRSTRNNFGSLEKKSSYTSQQQTKLNLDKRTFSVGATRMLNKLPITVIITIITVIIIIHIIIIQIIIIISHILFSGCFRKSDIVTSAWKL